MSGLPVDQEAWRELAERAEATVAAADTELATLLPGVNVNSPSQLRAALLGRGIDLPDTQEATLRAVADQDPAIAAVLRRKQASKLASTYGRAWLEYVDPVTGRIHADYQPIGAASGRMSCRAPNVQNLPKGTGHRTAIRPPEGRVFVRADLSQIELRVVAVVADERAMQQAFQRGDDLHATTAAAVLGRAPTKAERAIAKAVNFGISFGMGPTRLRSYARDDFGVAMDEREAATFHRGFFATYPGIKRWHQSQPAGPITTWTLGGRPRHGVESFTQKLASPVSGTAADLLKIAMAGLWRDRGAVPSAVPAAVVHDELLLEVDATEAEACAAWVARHLREAGSVLLPQIPVEVEVAIVPAWEHAPEEQP